MNNMLNSEKYLLMIEGISIGQVRYRKGEKYPFDLKEIARLCYYDYSDIHSYYGGVTREHLSRSEFCEYSSCTFKGALELIAHSRKLVEKEGKAKSAAAQRVLYKLEQTLTSETTDNIMYCNPKIPESIFDKTAFEKYKVITFKR